MRVVVDRNFFCHIGCVGFGGTYTKADSFRADDPELGFIMTLSGSGFDKFG